MVDQTAFRSDLAKQRLPLLDQPVLTPYTLEQLKVPDNVLLRPENVGPFLASQMVRLNEITERPEIKTLFADIPAPDEARQMMTTASLSSEENEHLQSWGSTALLKVQGGEADLDKLSGEIESFLDSKKKEPVGPPDKGIDLGGMMTDMALMRGVEESERERQEWKMKLVAAASSGDPAFLCAVIGERAAMKWMKKVAVLTKRQAFLVQQRDKVSQDLGLGKNPSQADLAKINIDFARFQGNSQTNMMEIQQAMSEYQRITQETKTLVDSSGKPLDVMLRNMGSR